MNEKIFDGLQKMVFNSDLPDLALFLFMNEIPGATLTFDNNVVIEMKTGIRNGAPSFSLEMYKKNEED